jgi:hypothetical protein
VNNSKRLPRARHEEVENAYQSLVLKSEGKSHLEDLDVDGSSIIIGL